MGTLHGCTVVKNRAWDYGGGGVCGGYCHNCIIWNNSSAWGVTAANWHSDGTYPLEISNSCSQPLPPGPGNIDGDPCFVNPAAMDFHLWATSPCRDAGSYASWLTFYTNDLDGLSRIWDGKPDMGAYEWADSDKDELPDWWEWKYTGTRTGLEYEADNDGDGAPTWHEWLAGTDPTDENSVFDAQGTKGWRESDGRYEVKEIVLRWNSVTGYEYEVLGSSEPDAHFEVIAGPFPGCPPVNVYTVDIGQAGEAGYYRVRGRRKASW